MIKSFFNKAGWVPILFFAIITYSQDPSGEILINHVGYPVKAEKVFLIRHRESPAQFRVINTQNNKTVFKGITMARQGYFGNYFEGNFTDVSAEGTYVIEMNKLKSEPFRIAANIYEDAIKKIVTYFSIQRCGPSTTGYAAPCHVDDGRRLDTGPGWTMKPYRDVSGGWHDAGDYRKWVAFTLFGMIGLSRVAEIMGPDWNRSQIEEELKWGNRYFLAMQNDAGYIMNFCGGDDGMFLTDNIPGTADDRPIHTEPASFVHNGIDRSAQYNFAQAQALTARVFKTSDPEYSKKCVEAASRCLAWCEKNFYANGATDMGAALMAYIELYKTTADKKLLDEALILAGRLMDIQVKSTGSAGQVRGYFLTSTRDDNPTHQSWQGQQHILGFCELVELLPGHKDAMSWNETIRMYCEDYLLPLIDMNNFNLVPIGLYKSDPGNHKKIGDFWVRYLPVTANNAWGGGDNGSIASTGTCLMHAARILNNQKLKYFAQRQLDWIIGLNPLNMSTADGIGRNQPIRFINSSLNIPPLIEGAVMNGIGATVDDTPDMVPGSWQNCEYWTPPTVQTMLLMAELNSDLR
jgi:hypothetical protein